VTSRAFFDQQTGFYWVRFASARHLFDISCRPDNLAQSECPLSDNSG
jgi:hypothetical protein